MFKVKLFGLSFCMAFTVIAYGCFRGGYPLMIAWDYSLSGFVDFAILIAFLCFCLVFVTLPALKFIRTTRHIKLDERLYYPLGTFIVHQFVALISGYVESSYHLKGGNLFYYYGGAGNRYVYLFAGNIIALFVAFLYAKKQKQLRAKPDRKYELHSSYR